MLVLIMKTVNQNFRTKNLPHSIKGATKFFNIAAILFLVSASVKAGGFLEEEILEALHQSGYAKAVRGDIQPLRGAGSNTQSVSLILVKQENREAKRLVCKELKESNGVKNERVNLETLEPLVSEYEKFTDSQPRAFPPQYVSFARYRGELTGTKRDFVLFDEASGQSVFDLMLEWTQKGYGWSGLDPWHTKNKLACHFTNVGSAIAAFHLKNGSLDEETSTFSTITHNDLHGSNIFYDIYSNKTTLIDYETMVSSYNIKRDIYGDVRRLFDFSKGETAIHVREKAGEEFARSRRILFFDEKTSKQRDSYINECLARLDDFFNALKRGYVQAFTNAGYTCDLDSCKVKRSCPM